MSHNVNPWVTSLLTWHGHSSAGVRIPFNDSGGNPLRGSTGVIRTPLLDRLAISASKIASDEVSPRWIFLVGGPGNGKSEAVEQFLMQLDTELGCGGALTQQLKSGFTAGPIVPWSVEVSSATSPDLPDKFHKSVGRLVVVQDASASERPNETAAGKLVDYIEDLLTHQHPSPVFVCCANRGLLASTLKLATTPQVEVFLRTIVQATGLGREALSRSRPSCWPLEIPEVTPGLVACWPLDLETLITPAGEQGYEASPAVVMARHATDIGRWEDQGCATCQSNDLCPLFQNARWLRDEKFLSSLIAILRRTELATAQRWNFRGLFSLVAELCVGDWADFSAYPNPCEWVHEQRELATNSAVETRAEPAMRLVSRLYPNALFPTFPPALSEETLGNRDHPLTDSFVRAVNALSRPATTHLRQRLSGKVSEAMDPARLSPHLQNHPLTILEDAYSQSPDLGNGSWPSSVQMSGAEQLLFEFGRQASDEWDILDVYSTAERRAASFVKIRLSALAKRSVGARLGHHANEEYLQDYELTIRDGRKLRGIHTQVSELLGKDRFAFNILAGLGQPQSEREWLVILDGDKVRIRPLEPAPSSSDTRPGHDLPAIHIGEPARGVIPLTFDMYFALRLRQDGCESSSLPASVRAALDQLKQLYAGALCRADGEFTADVASIRIGNAAVVSIERPGEAPTIRS